ncbi:hypothetical protein LQF59_06835 [Tetragenococcus koreensis]|uniref:hypothetical protein n=1 Tax=Tetragenococcus koreensis TaxID=290335 RepID=UPI001F161A5E|nr:hypothetical protein [Tetragenococcus koreensis]MCF1614776.1 hypothetical protein [Tetragenococcus koreensis]MCF1624658.1 hypothetical protein [Tetragenococcus koreensis]
MSEINHRYLKDNDGNRYFPVTHVEAVKGLETLINDSGWTEFIPVNGNPNQSFKGENDNGYDCSYRIIEIFDLKIKTVRINLSDIGHNMLIYDFPENFSEEDQSWLIRTPFEFSPATISLRTNGGLSVGLPKKDRNDWGQNNYIYGSFTWIE